MTKKKEYNILDEEEFYKTGKSRGVIKVSEEKTSKSKIVTFSREIQKSNGSWIPKKGKFFAVSFGLIGKIIDILIKFTRKFRWSVTSIKKPEEKIKKLERQLYEITKQKTTLEETIKNLEVQIDAYKKEVENYRRQIIKENIEVFKKDLEEFENLLNKNEQIKEKSIQEFLRKKQWIFGPEYYNAQPKKPVGSKSEFDFYLEDFKGKGVIVELKLPSDPIFSAYERFGLSSKCAESLGQLIRYIETTIAISHGTEISKIEEINETKPLGVLIIGRTKTKEDIKRLETVNFYFHKSIEIVSYDMLLNKAKALLRPFTAEEVKGY
jgi:hypothetical protein